MSLSSLLLALVAGGPFGRFGYAPFPEIPGVELSREGLRARKPGADRILFERPLPNWKPVAVGAIGAVYHVADDNPLGPRKARVDLSAPGLSAYFPQGLRLRVRSISAPFLSWDKGSVAAGVPTPKVPWIVVSFQDDQPPWIVGFDEDGGALQVDGRPGDWTISAPEGWTGWARLALPRGTRGEPAVTAAALGRLAKEASRDALLWRAQAPILVEVRPWAGPAEVAVRYVYDRPGALAPSWATLLPFTDARLTTTGDVRRTGAETEGGPQEMILGDEVAYRLPARAISPGRAVGVGAMPEAPATTSAFDAAGVTALAFRLLGSESGSAERTAAEALGAEFIGGAPSVPEPFTGARLPWAADGSGAELAAAHALLAQALATARGETTVSPLLTSLAWARDASALSLTGPDAARAATLAALAGSLSLAPEARVEGALWQAGLEARRGLARWSARRGAAPPADAPYASLRRALQGRSADAYAAYLFSPLRTLDGPGLLLDAESRLSWLTEGRPGSFVLPGATLTPLENLVELTARPGGVITYTPTAPGRAWSRLTPAPTLPPVALPAP